METMEWIWIGMLIQYNAVHYYSTFSEHLIAGAAGQKILAACASCIYQISLQTSKRCP
jgi:hypothetical protein